MNTKEKEAFEVVIKYINEKAFKNLSTYHELKVNQSNGDIIGSSEELDPPLERHEELLSLSVEIKKLMKGEIND